jgi:hypothetical protein
MNTSILSKWFSIAFHSNCTQITISKYFDLVIISIDKVLLEIWR